MDVLSVGVERHLYEVDGWGFGVIVLQGRLLLAHELPSTRRRPAAAPALPADGHASHGPTPHKGGTSPPEITLADDRTRVRDDFVSDVVGRVRCHLAGRETRYGDVTIELSWCTPFQAELASALRAVPWGEVVSYGELAALAGRPGAARAAGSFCAQNPYALVLPCHRVVGAAGIGGYGDSGVALKRRLLALEGVAL